MVSIDILCYYCDEGGAELQYPVTNDGVSIVGYQCEACAEAEHDAYWSGMVII